MFFLRRVIFLTVVAHSYNYLPIAAAFPTDGLQDGIATAVAVGICRAAEALPRYIGNIGINQMIKKVPLPLLFSGAAVCGCAALAYRMMKPVLEKPVPTGFYLIPSHPLIFYKERLLEHFGSSFVAERSSWHTILAPSDITSLYEWVLRSGSFNASSGRIKIVQINHPRLFFTHQKQLLDELYALAQELVLVCDVSEWLLLSSQGSTTLLCLLQQLYRRCLINKPSFVVLLLPECCIAGQLAQEAMIYARILITRIALQTRILIVTHDVQVASWLPSELFV